MGTVNKAIADIIKANDGYYGDDPRVQRIVEYDNAWGGVSYGIEHIRDQGKYRASEYVRNPRVYWEVNDDCG